MLVAVVNFSVFIFLTVLNVVVISFGAIHLCAIHRFACRILHRFMEDLPDAQEDSFGSSSSFHRV